jgi:N-acetylglucosamine-6-phosphate deacetylase
MESIRLENAFLVSDKGIKRTSVILRNSRIDLSGAKKNAPKDEETTDLKGKYVVPGFVDIHFHGLNLFDFTLGQFNPQTETFDGSKSAYEKGFDMLIKTLPRFGVTAFYISTFAASLDSLKNCYGNLADFLKKQQQDKTYTGARLLGGLLEGSFISPDMAGAQDPAFVFKPSQEAFDSIQDKGSIKLTLVGPDSGEPAVKLTKYLTDKGIIVGAGHTNATYNQVVDAVNAGLKYCIHFTNGPTGGSYKPFNRGGAIEAVLQLEHLFAELIADGYHVNPAYIRDIIKRKGVDKIIGMTDCMFVAGSSLKRIKIGSVPGVISDDGRYIAVENKKNTLFGSVLNMKQGFENMLNWLTSNMQGIWNRSHKAMDFEDALAAVSAMYSTNPCKLVGLDKEGFGKLTDGAKADLCILNITGSQGSYKVDVESTIVDGNIVYSKN